MKREKIKTLTLILLFTISISLIFLDTNLSKYTMDLKKLYMNNIITEEDLNFVIKPQRIFIHFGGGNNTEIIYNKDVYWIESKNILKEFLNKESKIQEINYKEYNFKKNIKSIELIFFKGMDGNILNKAIYAHNSPISNIKGIIEILIPLVDDKGVYFLTDKNKVFKIESDYVKDIEIVNELEKSDYTQYYTIHSIFDKIENNTMLPLSIENNYVKLKAKNYFNFENDEYIDKIAARFFNEKYAFTSRTVDTNGINTFVYGYGEKVLRIDPNGYIEYLNETVNDKELNKEDALIKALNFLRSQYIDINGLYVSNIKESTIKGKKSYSFGFSYLIKNLKVKTYDIKYPIEVTIIGDRVYSYKSILKVVEYSLNSDHDNHIMTYQEILDKNFKVFKKDLGYLTGEDAFENLEDIELVYFLNENDTFIPAWHLIIGKKNYIFDAYKGEILRYGLGKS